MYIWTERVDYNVILRMKRRNFKYRIYTFLQVENKFGVNWSLYNSVFTPANICIYVYNDLFIICLFIYLLSSQTM